MTGYKQTKEKKWPYILLWALSILGSWAILPYLLHLADLPTSTSLGRLFVWTTVRTAIAFGLVCFFSYLLVPRTDLEPFALSRPLKRIVLPGLIGGLVASLLIYLPDRFFFSSSLLSSTHPPAWTGVLGSLYGAINEEVLLRLFLFTLIYFLVGKIFRFGASRRLLFLWITNVIVAALFGIGHLPAAFHLTEPSGLEISRILLLNGLPGLIFGWLYWSRGLAAAMAAHFVADLMIHVVWV